MITARKIAASLGMTEICLVRCGSGDTVEALPSFSETGLMATVSGDGFVIVPQGSEGYPQGVPSGRRHLSHYSSQHLRAIVTNPPS